MARRFQKSMWIVIVALGLLAAGGLGYFALWTKRSPDPASAQAAYAQARQALDDDDLPRAIEHLQCCLDAWPFHAEAHFLMARASRRNDDPAAWQTHLYRAAMLQWPRNDIEFEQRLLRAQSGALPDVEEALEQHLNSFHPDKDLILEAIVKGFLATHRLQEATRWADFWREYRPDDYRPWLYRGRASFLNRSRGPAIADYRRALELKPDHGLTRLWLAAALMLSGQFRDALAEYQTYLADHPGHPAALLGLANCQVELNQKDDARATLAELLEKSPENAAALLVRARLELDLNAPAEALKWLGRAEAAAPYDPGIAQAFVSTLRQLGRTDEAARYQRRQRELQEQFKQLEEAQQKVVQEPNNVAHRHRAGELSLRLGQDAEAIQWFQSALGIDPNHRPTHRALAEWYRNQGETRRAEEHARKAAGQ